MHDIEDTDIENENENNISSNSAIVSGNANGNVAAAAGADNFSGNYNPDFEIHNSSIETDMYTSGFTGLMRIYRLVFLAEHCPTIRIDALKLAINYVLETYNTQLYSSIHKQLTEAYYRQLAKFNLKILMFK
jgi:hypothetical protein